MAVVHKHFQGNTVNNKLRGSGGDPSVRNKCLSIWWKISASFCEEKRIEGESHLNIKTLFWMCKNPLVEILQNEAENK